MKHLIDNQKFKLGVSVNHKSTQNHSMIKFTEREMTLDEIVQMIRENCFFYPLVEQNAFKDGVHPVVKATDFKSTCLIPFDFDFEKGRGIPLEQCLQMLGDDLCPTIAFRTRSYDAEAHVYHYRLMYLFDTYVIGRQEYYTLIASVKKALIKRLGEIGDDGDAYGFNTKEKGWKGHCCKPIRTNSKGEVVVSRRIFNVSDFELDETFIRHPELIQPKRNNNQLTENYIDEALAQFIIERDYKGIERFPLLRDFSYTHSQFHNGFAVVRGNSDYAEFPRKFTFSKRTHRYEAGRWEDGDKRRKKLRLVALISRFNDYIDNEAETISGNDLFLSVYYEAKRHYRLNDSFDTITPTDLQRIVNEVMALDINKVLDIVRLYTSSADRGKRDHKGIIRKRNLIRIDKSFWGYFCEGKDVRLNKIKSELRFATRYILLLKHYNQNISRRENTEYLNTLKEIDPTIPGCSLSQLSLFRGHCSKYLEEADKTIALEDLLFIDSGLSIENIPSKYSLIKTMLEDKPELREKIDFIVNHPSTISKRSEDGSIKHPDIGRPTSDWQSVLTDDDANLTVSEIVKILETKGFTPPKNSIKSWKYRILKRTKE